MAAAFEAINQLIQFHPADCYQTVVQTAEAVLEQLNQLIQSVRANPCHTKLLFFLLFLLLLLLLPWGRHTYTSRIHTCARANCR